MATYQPDSTRVFDTTRVVLVTVYNLAGARPVISVKETSEPPAFRL